MNRMDKPEPPSEYQKAAPEGLVGAVSTTILSAYKINPIMIAMIVLLLTIMGALGYYMIRNDDRIYAYIAARDQQQANLWDRLVAMAKDCRTVELDKESYPSLDFPKLSTKPQATHGK